MGCSDMLDTEESKVPCLGTICDHPCDGTIAIFGLGKLGLLLGNDGFLNRWSLLAFGVSTAGGSGKTHLSLVQRTHHLTSLRIEEGAIVTTIL